MSNRIGNRPRFPLPNQRFDKGDAENIARYYEEIISRFTGSIYGQAWGCMSNPQFEVVTGSLAGPYIRPKRCVLLYTVPADGTLNTTDQDLGPWNATIVQFDPARAGQPVQSLYTSTYFPAGRPPLRPWILFRRSEAATNTGNKAYWDTDSNTEEVGAAPLQDSEYVEFRLSTTYSSGDRGDGWYRCAYIDSWGTPASAATPVIVPVHWMDSQYYLDDVPPAQGTRVASALAHPAAPSAANVTGFDPQSEMPELAKLLHWIVGKLGQHYTANVRQVTDQTASLYGLKPGAFVNLLDTEGWLQRPVRGLLEIESYINTLQSITLPEMQAEVTAQQHQIARAFQTPRLLHTLYAKPNNEPTGLTEWPYYTFTVSALTTTPSDPVTYSNSFSPTLVPYTGQVLGDYELGYRITPVANAMYWLDVELLTGTNFLVTSFDISFEAQESGSRSALPTEAPQLTLRYRSTAPAAMPPSSYVHGMVLVRTTDEFGALDRRAIIINVYGRNI